MIITRKKQVPSHWLFYAQLPLMLSIYGNYVINAPFLLMMKRFIDNPAAIMGLISIEFYLTLLGGPFIAWLSDRIWTRFGRRKMFLVIADVGKGLLLLLMPLAPSLWGLIIIRWLYGLVGDFGSMTQALIYETVPPKQRGKLSGLFQGSLQVGNLVFFFLLYGRFDDVYFMGPFQFLTEIGGGTLLFWTAAIPFIGVALFEGLAFKEIKPPNQKLLKEEKGDENFFIYFIKQFFKDIFAKDFAPLYLLVTVNVMFGVGLGLFRPLLFIEQWGYDLQDMGNVIAIGTITTITFSLLSGYVADKWGKLQTFTAASIASFIINVFYTVYVYLQPDYRPSLTEIVVIGNIGATFGMIKGVVSYPLQMEFVRRDRMGAANAGLGLFNSLVRNLITLFVGVWLVWWSGWFHPQAGYQIEAIFPNEMNEMEVRDSLQSPGIDARSYELEPLHTYGVDSDISTRWWIHRNDERSHELLTKRKKLTNQLAPLETKLDNPMLKLDKRTEIEEKLSTIKQEVAEINSELQSGLETLEGELKPVLESNLVEAGSQISVARLSESELQLTLQTIESISEEQLEEYHLVLEAPQYAVIPGEDAGEWVSDLKITTADEEEQNALHYVIQYDPNFLILNRALTEAYSSAEQRLDKSGSLLSSMRVSFGYEKDAFRITSTDGVENRLQLTIQASDAYSENELGEIAGVFQSEDWVKNASLGVENNETLMLQLVLEDPKEIEPNRIRDARREEVRTKLGQLNEDWDTVTTGLVTESYLRFTDALAAQPFYVTVPERTPRSRYSERRYEYFFSSQSLMIITDVFGLWVIFYLIRLEKRGKIHRQGVEEDERR